MAGRRTSAFVAAEVAWDASFQDRFSAAPSAAMNEVDEALLLFFLPVVVVVFVVVAFALPARSAPSGVGSTIPGPPIKASPRCMMRLIIPKGTTSKASFHLASS